jgi:hypothetical protein
MHMTAFINDSWLICQKQSLHDIALAQETSERRIAKHSTNSLEEEALNDQMIVGSTLDYAKDCCIVGKKHGECDSRERV